MIYMNWFHQNLPRILGALSFIMNPTLILLVLKNPKSHIGEYRNLLIIFAIFDICYSISEVLTPLGVQGNSHGFVVFISDGWFFEYPEVGQHVVSNRCGFISLSYALLIIHFVYRYIALFHPHLITKFFKPIGILIGISFMSFHIASWTLICQNCLAADEEIREIVSKDFLRDYNVDSKGVPMLAALYWGVRPEIQYRSWLGIILLSLTSSYAISVYIILGYKTCIPIFASYLPTVVSWYAPIFGIDIGWFNTNVSTVALAAFPCIDPLAVILLIPTYRNAILRRKGGTVETTVQAMTGHVKVNNQIKVSRV